MIALSELEKKPKKYSSDPKERARQLVAEGKIGGARKGAGRPRHKRASELVAEKAETHANKIVAAYLNALDPNNTIKPEIRLQAAREWLEIERQERELQLKEEKRGPLEDRSPTSLLAFILENIEDDIIVEGTVVEDGSPATLEAGEEGGEGPEAEDGGAED